ncbi:MAG: DUF2235 domain-containing protein [Pseudomonadales bacterium]|nr:DUF2235 domain-containing protein [Pseudomonadales bacterium]
MRSKKRIILCCDGTWNQPDIDPTNVVKLVRSIRPTGPDGTEQVVFYDEGVGTGSRVDRLLGGAFGKGVAKNVLDCYRFLVHNYSHEDEIYCFGFSRGAYTARAVAGFVHAVGLMEKSELETLPKAYRYYRTPPEQRPNSIYDENVRPDIRMIGVWDTVGAMGAPTPLLKNLTSHWVGFFNTHLSPQVKHAYQALALDEQRGPFAPDLWTGQINDDQTVEQCWFRGVHSDIGGGYKEAGLSDIALLWMADKARTLGLDFDATYLAGLTDPDPAMPAHDSFSTGYRLLEMLRFEKGIRAVYGDPADPPLNVAIHHSVERLVRSGKYLPRNPDFPELEGMPSRVETTSGIATASQPAAAATDAPDSDTIPSRGEDRRQSRRHQVGPVEAELAVSQGAQPMSCQLLDFSPGGGVRIRTEQAIKEGDRVQIASDLFDPADAVCVWHQGDEHGLAFVKAA